MSRYTPEQISEARAGLERTASEGGAPWLKWSDEDVEAHLDKWLPFQECMQAAARQMSAHVDKMIYAAIANPTQGRPQ